MERSMKKILILLAAVMMLVLAGCGQAKADSPASLNELLAAEGSQTIKLTEDLVLTEPLVVNGDKIITGPYTITLNVTETAEGEEGPGFSLLGCPKLTAEDWSADAAVLQVAEGSTLTLEGDVVIDGAGVSNGVVVQKGATLNMTENAIVQNGLNCGIYVCEEATLNVSGGSVLTSVNHGVVNMGTMNVTGGTLSGTEKGAVIYSAGTLEVSEGNITAGGVHNIYVAGGSANVTGGKIDWAEKDGIVVASDANATVTGGAIENCGTHGLCNSGNMETGAIVLYECGIANNAGGTLNMTDTTVEVSPVYCLANMGGTVTATNFTTLSCDVTSICNFAGDMTLDNLSVSGSRAGNISNESGNLTVNTATLGLCREKPINVGSGVCRMDNVTVEGTTGEYFGAYIYGGEFYLSNSSINFINYSALRADGQCYVELNNVSVDDTMASGIWARGATIVANKLSLNNIRGHAINNAGGNITITDLKATDIGKNAIIQDNGVTTLNGVSFQNVGDQGAYVKSGKLNITDGWFDNVAQNGVYSVPSGTGEVVLKDVTYSRVAKYGLNNGHIMSAQNVKILCNSGTGILNKKLMWLQNVQINDPAGDCIYNDTNGELHIAKVTVSGAPSGKTAVFNRGALHAYFLNIQDSDNGLVNKDTGYVTVEDLNITGTLSNGINNQGRMELSKTVSISNILGTFGKDKDDAGNAIMNSGDLAIDGDLVISNVASTGSTKNSSGNAIFNKGGFTVTGDVTIGDVASGYAILGSGGNMDVDGTVTVNGTVGSTRESIIYFYSKAETASFGELVKTSDVNMVVLKANGSAQVTVENSAELKGISKDVVVSNGSALITLNNTEITGGNNALRGYNGDITANNVRISGSVIGINADKIGSDIKITGNSSIRNTTGTYAVYAKKDTNVIVENGTLDIGFDNKYSKSGVNVAGNLQLTSGELVISSARKSMNVDGTVNGDAASVITVADNSSAEHGIYVNGTFNMGGTVNVAGVAAGDLRLIECAGGTTTIGVLNRADTTAREVLRANNSAEVTINGGTINGGSGKDVIVASGASTINVDGLNITGGNNALFGAGGDINATGVTISGSTIGINIRNANSLVTVKGNSSISNTTHGSAVHVNAEGKLSVQGALTVNSKNTQVGVNVYAGSTLELVGGTLVINDAQSSLNVNGIVNGDAASVITVNNNSAAKHGIYVNGTFNMNGTVNVSGAAAGDLRLIECVSGKTTIGTLNRADTTAREVLRSSGSAEVTINGGTIYGDSSRGKDVLLANNTSTINVNNATIIGGNAAVRGNGGKIVASGVTVDGSKIGINITNANSEVVICGAYTVNNTTYGSAVYVQKGGKVTVSGGALTVNSNDTQVGVNVTSGSTLNLVGGTVVINNAKKSMNVDGTVSGDAASVITLNNNSAAEYAIYHNGAFNMNGTVNINNSVASDKQLILAKKDMTIGVLNASTTEARPILTTDGTVTVTVNGGTVAGHKSKDVFIAPANGTININNVTVNGGNNVLYTTGGTINGTNVTVNGGVIAINESAGSNGVVTLSGTNTFANTTHGTCMHIRGALTLNDGATLTIQDPANVGFKIYSTGTLTLKDNSVLKIVNCQKGWNVEANSTFTRSETSVVTVNDEEIPA